MTPKSRLERELDYHNPYLGPRLIPSDRYDPEITAKVPLADAEALLELVKAGEDVKDWLIRNKLDTTAHGRHFIERLSRITEEMNP